MAWRPLTIVAIERADMDAVRVAGITKRELAARACARIPGGRYWLCVLALWMGVSACAWGLYPSLGFVGLIYSSSALVTTVGRLFAALVCLLLPAVVLMVVTRWNRPFVYAARREIGDPICGACGYPAAPPDGGGRCSECGSVIPAPRPS